MMDDVLFSQTQQEHNVFKIEAVLNRIKKQVLLLILKNVSFLQEV